MNHCGAVSSILGASAILVAVGRAGVTANTFSCPATTTLATFNAGLLPAYRGGLLNNGDPVIEERAAVLIEEIRGSDVDILCLQEIYFADIQRQIYRALKDVYPHVFTATNLVVNESDPATMMACTPTELQAVANCFTVYCSGAEGERLLACGSFNCSSVPSTEHCLDCASLYAAAIGGPVIEQCLTQPASRFERNYELMLLSKKRLTNTLASGFNNRSQFEGYLEASVEGVGDIVCTHLTSLQSTEIYYGPPLGQPLYSNYDEHHYDELLTIIDILTRKDVPILMGDINNGPATPGNTVWELPFHYGLIAARGFVSPYVLEDGRCTFCVDNPAVVNQLDKLIDHIYITTDSYKGRVVSSKRIFDNSLMAASGVPLSDHYGVSVTLKDIQSECRWWDRRRYYCPPQPDLRLIPLPIPQPELTRLCVRV